VSCAPHRDELILLLDPELAEGSEPELGPAESAALREHVQGCASCQDDLIRLTLALAAAVEEPAPLAAVAAATSPEVFEPFGRPPIPDETLLPRAGGRYRRSARAAALAEGLPRHRSQASAEDLPNWIADYEVLDELGRGGTGVVYRARGPEGTEVALRVCLGLPARLLERRQRDFERIRSALSSHTSPRLAGPLASFLWEAGEDAWWVEVMPLLRGPSLEDLLQGGRCDPREATEIAVEVACAVREAHSAGLVLADLKPADVFLEAEGVRVLVPERPFEVAENQLTCTGALIGTPFYLSPEQARGQRPDARSDLFAVGAIYHALLTGAPPNQGPETYFQVLRDRIEMNLPEPDLPELSKDHKVVLARLLAADPERRYQDAEAALADLLLVKEEVPLQRDDPSWEQVVRLHPPLLNTRASALALLGLVAALAALAALAYFLLG